MAIAFNSFSSATTATNSGSTTLSFSHTVSGTNTILIVCADLERNLSQTVTGVTYAGVSMVALYAQSFGGGRYSGFYYLINPTTGANNVVISISATTTFRLIGAATSYSGVSQSGFPDAQGITDQSAGTVSSISTSVTTTKNNSWLIGATCVGSAPSAGTNTTSRGTQIGDDTIIMHDSNTAETPPGLYSQNINQSPASFGWQFVASMAPVAPPTNGNFLNFLTLLGVGQ